MVSENWTFCQDDTKYNLSYHIDQGTEANSSLEKIMEKCQICFNCKSTLREPVTPKCGHKICKECLAGKSINLCESVFLTKTFFRLDSNRYMRSLLSKRVSMGLWRRKLWTLGRTTQVALRTGLHSEHWVTKRRPSRVSLTSFWRGRALYFVQNGPSRLLLQRKWYFSTSTLRVSVEPIRGFY